MKLKFLNFVLDRNKQTLFCGNTEVKLNNKSYALLSYLLENHNRLITKDEIMTQVWSGRIVSENTLNQNVSTLRKLLAKYSDETIIKTAYGKGFEFVPNVVVNEVESKTKPTNNWLKKPLFLSLGFFGLILILANILLEAFNLASARNQNLTPVLMLESNNKNDWLSVSSNGVFNLLASLPNNNNTLKINALPNANDASVLENYWRINPKTEVIKSHFEILDEKYHLNLNIIKKNHEISEAFTHAQLLKVIQQGNDWLIQNSSLESTITPIDGLLTEDSHTLELYMRGFYELKQGNFEAAKKYTELAVSQNTDFYLARIQIAEIKYRQGENQSSLAELEALSQINTLPELQIPIGALRGDVLDTSGQFKEAADIYQQLITTYEADRPVPLLDIRYNFSYTLASQLKYKEALEQLEIIREQITPESNMELYAHTLQKTGSINLQLGHTEKAQQDANKSLNYFNQLADEMSAAKVKILLARIANHKSDYTLAIHYLSEAVATYRQADFALGVGATLNELIYAQRINGELTAAWNNMQEMKQIAVDIEYFAMLMAAKEAEFHIALDRQQYDVAEGIIENYLKTSQAKQFARGLFKHNLLALDLVIAQKQPESAHTYIEAIQKHIAESNETRLKPRLKVQQARVSLLKNQVEQAIQLLEDAKSAAAEFGDQETVNRADMLLIEHHINQENWPRAKSIIKTAAENEPQPYPFLLYQSKIMKAEGDLVEAILLAQLCKQKAKELWRSADEKYLNGLISAKKTANLK